MGRVIQIAVVSIALMFSSTAASSAWFWTNWWGNQKQEQQQQQEQIQKRVVTKCERDVAYWRQRWAEHPENPAYKQYYLEAKKRCEQDKQQYERKWK